MTRFTKAWVPAFLLAALLPEPIAVAQPAGQANEEWLRAVERLGPMPGAAKAPFEILDGDQRGVLFAYPFLDLKVEQLTWDRKSGTAKLRATLPERLAESSRLSIQARVSRDRRLRYLPAKVIVRPPEEASQSRRISIDFEHPVLKRPGGKIFFRARHLPDEAIVHTTREVLLPPRATLGFGFGFLLRPSVDTATASSKEPTRFTVSVCRDGTCESVFDEAAQPTADEVGWNDRAVALHGLEGQRVTFRFEAARTTPAEARSLPVWSIPTVYAREPREDNTPNLLLISLDTLRADHLGTYGYARDTSPFIDRELAGRGTVFERCYSAATTTAPSHMSMFTGLAPTAHGVYGGSYFRGLANGIPTLAEALRQQGFETAAVTENGAMGAYRGFNRGFASYYEDKRRDLSFAEGHIERTLERSLSWLDQNDDKRFFLFIHTYQVHYPYTPPLAFQSFFEGDGLDSKEARLLPPEWNPVLYDREIRYTDSRLERFFAEAAARGLLSNTIVVLLSDHGEEFAEHGALGHGPGVPDEVLHVPLVIRGPGVASGRRVEEPVSLVDLTASLLDLAGVARDGFPGQSFANRTRQEAGKPQAEARPFFSEANSGMAVLFTREGGARPQLLPVPVYTARWGDRKLIRNLADPADPKASPSPGVGPFYRYFDLAADPGERRDLWGAARPEALQLRDVLEQHIVETEEQHGRNSAAIRTETGTPDVLDADRREKLKALGYVE